MGSRNVSALRHQWSEDGIHGLGFGEDDAESGHQITEPVGCGVEALILLVGYVPLVHRCEHGIFSTDAPEPLAPIIGGHIAECLASNFKG